MQLRGKSSHLAYELRQLRALPFSHNGSSCHGPIAAIAAVKTFDARCPLEGRCERSQSSEAWHQITRIQRCGRPPLRVRCLPAICADASPSQVNALATVTIA